MAIIVDSALKIIAGAIEIYNRWFGYHISPEQVKLKQANLSQKEIDEFNVMLAKAKSGDRDAQNWVRKKLSSP
jgi:hypothetical protein